jgi:hypothetical protein
MTGLTGVSSLFRGRAVWLTAAQLAAYPTLTFQFTTTTGAPFIVSIPAALSMIPLAAGSSFYWLGISYISDPIFILGDIFLQMLYVVYDQATGRLGVAPVADCMHVYVAPVSCPAGTHSPLNGATSASACVACAPGTYSVAGASTCDPCALATFSNASGASACAQQCPAGTYGLTTGATSLETSCAPCSPGFASSAAARSSCVACSPGSYSNASGSTVCASCAVGAFSSV